MLVDSTIIDELYKEAGETKVQKARLYVRTGRTEIEKINYDDNKNFEITGKVRGQEIYRTHIHVKDGEINDLICECIDYQNRYAACEHVVATIMEFVENSKYEEMLHSKTHIEINRSLNSDLKYRSFKQIVNEFYAEEMQKVAEEDENEQKNEKVRIEPKFIYDKYTGNLKMEIKIGNQRMYKVKDLSEFYEKMVLNTNYRYGNKLEFIHKKEAFEERYIPLLEFIIKQSEIIKFVNSEANSNYRYYGKAISESYILLNNSGLDEIFEILKSQEVAFQKEYKEEMVKFKNENQELQFIIQKKGKTCQKIKILV